jgi:ABC-type polysaccharide/polyol phosphate transport system ATPase subunit
VDAITLSNVSKIYRKYSGRQFATLKSALLQRSILTELSPTETFPALRDVSFMVAAGRTCGVIGRNGSGKSTALKLVAGITKPTSGTVAVRGRISALIELGAGFHPEISGRENVFINGIMLGLSRREIERRFDEIVEFAELREFIEAPVKTYSSGMYMRLGFAVAIHVDPDVLLVDEVLAVGDEGFTHKCLDKFAEFRRTGKTILLVTHSLGLVERFCDEALWLDEGCVRSQGDPKRVVDAYLAAVEKSEDALLATTTAKAVAAVAPAPVEPVTAVPDQGELKNLFQAVEGRWGSRQIEITRVTLAGREGESFIFHTGEPMQVSMKIVAHAPATDFVFGVSLFNADGVCCYGTNTYIEQMDPLRMEGEVDVAFSIESLDLVEGTYKLDVAVHTCDGYPYDYHRLLYTFRVKSRTPDVGIYRPRHHWSFSDGVRFKQPE